MALQTRHVYRFGDFSLDATAKILLSNGAPMRLARKTVETLLVLLEHPDQVLTKDELMQSVWQGRVVDEANLLQNIAIVRKALHLTPGMPGYIETFPGRGYRILGPIVEGEEALHGPDHLLQPVAPSGIVASVVDGPLVLPLYPAVGDKTLSRSTSRLVLGATAALLLLVASGWFVETRRALNAPGNDRQQFHKSAVERLGGKEFEPAISSDGRNIAFTLQRNDGKPSRIRIRVGDRPPVMIGQAGWDYTSPAWSPDGQSLALMRFSSNEGELVVTTAGGAGQRMVTSLFRTRFGFPYHHLSWSPDGQWLAFDDTQRAEQPFGICLVSTLTGERRRLTNPQPGALGDAEPRFSPDGTWVSFIRVFHRSRQGLYRASTERSFEEQIPTDTDQVSGQDWTGPGEIVLSSKHGEEYQLFRVRLRPHFALVRDVTDAGGLSPVQLAVAAHAHILLYAVLREDFNVWRLALRGTPAGEDRWTPIVSSSAQDASPQYSPDGSQVCFRSDRTGEEHLWTVLSDGSNPQQITKDSVRPSVGRWSRDGNSIVFNDSRDRDIYIAKRDSSSNWQTVSTGVKGTHPVFSPDGKWIYAGTPDRIFRFAIGSLGGQTVANTTGLSFGFSHDGKDLYFVRNVVDSTLLSLNIQTREISSVFTGLIPYCSSCWAAGTQGIYYLGVAGPKPPGQAIYFHPYNGGKDTLIADYPEPLSPLGGGPFSLSPDGSYLLCVRVDQTNSDVMRLEPFR